MFFLVDAKYVSPVEGITVLENITSAYVIDIRTSLQRSTVQIEICE